MSVVCTLSRLEICISYHTVWLIGYVYLPHDLIRRMYRTRHRRLSACRPFMTGDRDIDTRRRVKEAVPITCVETGVARSVVVALSYGCEEE